MDKKYIKDSNEMSHISKNQNEKDVFERSSLSNSSIEFARAKAEKLAIAIHMITNFISESEPVRTHLREGSLVLLSKLSLTNSSSVEGVSQDKIKGVVFDIIGLLDVAHATGYVSKMNWEILRHECSEFVVFLHERSDVFASSGKTFSDNFFTVSDNDFVNGHVKTIDKNKNNINLLKSSGSFEKEVSKTKVVKDITTRNTKGHASTKREPGRGSVVVERRDSRRTVIVDLLKKKGRVTVKDISAVVQDCSEKTLQRELLALVNEGILRKEGERRWSTYFLV